jgi:hypothetical protein
MIHITRYFPNKKDVLQEGIVSPSANTTGDYWSHTPFYVYDCNRPLAPILRQRWCSLAYDVYWLARWLLFLGIEIHGTHSRIRTEYLQNNTNTEQLSWITNIWTKALNKSRTINNWQGGIINKYWINTSIIQQDWNVTVQYLHRVKYLCDYRTDNCNPICPGIKGVTSDVQTRAFLLPQQDG